jgi:hypothetical protein
LSAKRTRIVPDVLAAETEGLFTWQYGDGKCPNGCEKGPADGCVAKKSMEGIKDEL